MIDFSGDVVILGLVPLSNQLDLAEKLAAIKKLVFKS